jgi:hypothetical protein
MRQITDWLEPGQFHISYGKPLMLEMERHLLRNVRLSQQSLRISTPWMMLAGMEVRS